MDNFGPKITFESQNGKRLEYGDHFPDDGKIVNHQPEFTEATIKPAAIEAIKNGSVLLASTVLELDSL